MAADQSPPPANGAQTAYLSSDGTPPGAAARGAVPLALLCMAQFMLILDIAIVNVALPAIQTDLGFGRENLQLVVTAYTLSFGGLLLLGGRLADVLGRRRVFVAGLLLFTLASLGCGVARSDGMLVAARAVQGIGGALVSPAALALLITIYPEGPERNRALGVWSAVAAGGGAAGLLLGGALTDLTGWRSVFLVNVPLGALVALAAWRALSESRPARGGRIDLGGAVAATGGLIALVYGLSRGEQAGFGDPLVLGLLASGATLLAAFVVVERRVREPLVPFKLFRLPTLLGANMATLLLSAVVLGVNYFLTLYFQQVQGYSPLRTGVAFLPLTFAAALASGVAARLVGHVGARRLLLAAMLALAAGSATLAQISPGSTYVVGALPGLLLAAIGLGFGFTVGTLAATAGVAPQLQGVSSGIFNTSQQIGGALGLAVLATVAGAGTGAAVDASTETLTAGFRAAFWAMTGLAGAAALVVLALVRERDCAAEMARLDRQSGPLSTATGYASPCQPAVTRLASGSRSDSG